MHPLDQILEDLRSQSAAAPFSRTRDQGTAFERICIAFLKNDRQWTARYENVQTWAAWAGERGLRQTDTGIDLVAELRSSPGAFAAIQCKYRSDSGSISKAEIDSFLSASGRSEFRERLIIDTVAGRAWSKNAEDTLRAQEVRVGRLGLHDLKKSNIDWSKFTASTEGDDEIALKDQEPKSLHPHQQKAVAAACKGLQLPGTRGKIIMACGTGKTLVALRATEELVGRGGRVLVLVPSLALLSQMLRAWLEDALLPIRAFAVCSDAQTGKRKGGDADMAEMDILDLAWPATTKADVLAREAGRDDPDSLIAVFATYQSSKVIEAAQRKHGLPHFNLAIADEAHRTAGALMPDEDPSPFVVIHDEKAIFSERRLYMTATPKVYAETARTRAGEFAATLCSMDDEDRYGPVLHETRFGEAVERKILSDYHVIVLTVPERLAAEIHLKDLGEGAELTLDEQGRMIGCLRALAKIDTDEFSEDDRQPMRRAIAFCNRIKSSENIEKRIHEVAEAANTLFEQYSLSNENTPPPRKNIVSSRHIDGTFNASARAEVLQFLEETPDGETRILTNARCLTEGVDVPSLDAILFMHPRKSQIEIVQAVGRVMRTAQGKKYGYVILPVVVPDSVTPEHALDDDSRWQVVWQTLNAIRSHDERFEGMINRIEAGDQTGQLSIIGPFGWNPPVRGQGKPRPDPRRQVEQFQGELVFEGLPEAIRAKIVEKCGNRKYWEDWAVDVARIARAHIKRIGAILKTGEAEREIFEEFLRELRDDLNPEISDEDAVEMLAQHMVTRPVFDALFGEDAATRANPVGEGMQTVLDVLEPAGIGIEAESLNPFYDSVRRRVQGATTGKARQEIVVELYDKFFRKAFPRVTEKLGIAYTPVEVVDFILHSVQDVLQDEFSTGIGEDGIHVLDPFAGTGTFLVRLIESELISPVQLVRKFGGDGRTPELHANEILLLAYYIGAVNVETAFRNKVGGKYRPFEGICLTDTFALDEDDDLIARLFPDNSERRTRQKALDIRVIVGNPPWRAGQRSAADNNPNASYPTLESRVSETYAVRAKATLKKNLYDSYKMAIRWASDRIGERGVVAFVTNGSWIDGNADSGVRACLAEEFHSIYVVNLKGKIPGSKEEGGNIFGVKVSSTVLILIKNPDAKHRGCRIRFCDIGNSLSKEEKLDFLHNSKSISGIKNWRTIEPDIHHDWIRQRNAAFDALYPLGSKTTKSGKTDDAVFRLFSNGYLTGRDAYLYNFSAAACEENARAAIDEYMGALRALESEPDSDLHEITRRHSVRLRWDRETRSKLMRRKTITFAAERTQRISYRPFVQKYGYIEHVLAAMKYQMDRIFPAADSDNLVICTPGIGSTKPFSVLMVDTMPDFHFVAHGQCFPRYRYQQPGTGNRRQSDLLETDVDLDRVDNITDAALAAFQHHYGDDGIGKDDIFYYAYGVLHASDWYECFANDLVKELPRLPFAPDFHAFREAGRNLAEIHLNYETGPEYPLKLEVSGGELPKSEHFRLATRKMRFEDDRTTFRINDNASLRGIPESAHDYQVNGRTPLEWFIDRYRVTRDKQSGIINDPNSWFENPADIVRAIRRIVHVSVETARIVEGLPEALNRIVESG